MLKCQSILKRFCSNFGFYISGPILAKYEIPHQISTLIPQLQISKSQLFKMLLSQFILNRFGSNFGFYILGPILTKYMISKQISTNPTTLNLKISTNSNAYISVKSQLILVNIWILNLMTNPSKVYDTELNLNHFKCIYLSQFSFYFYQTLDQY